ncbi:hypothetical protein GPL15_17835 [Clostridium sp. MCC353]|uniref:hypothetical protein n=1 Tax=Clostridium sp. MCC353 TaxID=2592646 RepID=UPI001C03A155|nr:hypothetical protein [Clostridium sp. MCC353]MBT9778361.1 hypothetical protein [Clostridium sp. MCC353]
MKSKEIVINSNSSDGGTIDVESSVKLACKQLSISIATSDEHPMLLDQLYRSRR